jgi:hypothetical protein
MQRPDNVKVGDKFVVNALAKRNNDAPNHGSTLNAGDVVTCVDTGGYYMHPSLGDTRLNLLWSELEGPYEEIPNEDELEKVWDELLGPSIPTQDEVMLRLIKASPETALLLIKELSA